ncbi:MAG: hypothetical protein GX171_06430 [Clostridiales bacterium]|jgi:hypothetical protein|nr:hypothetical protein [Clostridiales bacterium]
MSENRSRYSSAPLQDVRRRPARPPQTQKTSGDNAQTSTGSFVILQIMLVAVLPIFFVIALLAKDTRLYWTFVVLSLFCLASMYILKAFVQNARKVLGVIHAAMVVVVLFTLLVSGGPKEDQRSQTAQDRQSIFNDDTTASIRDMSENLVTQQETETAAPSTASLAQQKLEQFMTAWSSKNYAAMVSYSAPNWTNKFETQRDAETEIFHLSAIRTPVNYQILDVSGTDADQTRTINMQALISKSDGREPQLYNFQVLMIRANNEWFVDPNSISSSQVVEQTNIAQQALSEEANSNQVAIPDTNANTVAVPQITTARSDTLLYYNQDGGEFYHLDPNCSSIGTKYRPLKASFFYRDVSNDTFKNLKTCPYCNAPSRP